MYFARKIAPAWLSMVCHGLPRKRLLFWLARNPALILVHYHAPGGRASSLRAVVDVNE
jgi:hypothetical protein